MLGDEIASLVLRQYDRLPAKGKPLLRSNGVQEWTVLAGIVIRDGGSGQLQCVALATGVKAQPDAKLPTSNGRMLHDSHAEILAVRAFNRYVLHAGIDHISEVYLYVCAPPCGDASMSLLNGAESWSSEPISVAPGELIRGRAHFNLLGHIRTKPGRADSQLTMSKSCTDKLCLRQSRGLLLAPAQLAFGSRRLFLTALVCPEVLPDFVRAFSRWDPMVPFQCWSTNQRFSGFHPDTGAPSPVSLVWWHFGVPEVIANGVLQGSRRPSRLCRAELAQAARTRAPAAFAAIHRYSDLKTHSWWPPHWVRTTCDDFNLDTTEGPGEQRVV